MSDIYKDKFYNKNKEIETNLIKIENIEKESEIEKIKSNQINILNVNVLPENTKKYVKAFSTLIENIINKCNSFSSFTINNFTDTIKDNLKKLKVNNNNIINNFPNNLAKENLDILNKDFRKPFYFLNKKLINNIKSILDLLYNLFLNLKKIKDKLIENKTKLEKISESIKDLKNNEENIFCFIYNLYIDLVEYFKKIDIILDKLNEVFENFSLDKERKNISEELNNKKENIIKKIKKLNNKDINNYSENINTSFDILNDFIKNIISKKKELQKYKIVEENLFLEKEEKLRLDILIILDTTSSMDKYLKILKDEFKKIIEEIKKECPLSLIYIGFIGYKDFRDLELGDEYTDIDLTLDYENLHEQIKSIEVDGGGDIPEDVAGAFKLALNKNWSNGIKLAFLITDSPCHGKDYHDLEDDYPDGFYKNNSIEEYKREDIKKLIKEFTQKDIYLVCFDLHSCTKIMYESFKKIYDEEKKSQLFSIEKDRIDKVIIRKAIDLLKNKKKEIITFLKDNIKFKENK